VVSAAPCEPNSSIRWNLVGHEGCSHIFGSRNTHTLPTYIPIARAHTAGIASRKPPSPRRCSLRGFSRNFIPIPILYRSCAIVRSALAAAAKIASERIKREINLCRYYVCEIVVAGDITRGDLCRAGDSRLLIKSPFLSRETKLWTSRPRSKRRRTIVARCKTSAISPLCHRQRILFA